MDTPTTLAPTFDPEAQRKKVAMALMAQRGMGQQHPWGQFANTALQLWNKNRTIAPPTSTMQPMQPETSGYPVVDIGGG